MPRYRFQFETGHLYDGSTEIVVRDFVAEIEEISPFLATVIEARGGQLIEDEPVRAKSRKRKSVKWTEKEGEK